MNTITRKHSQNLHLLAGASLAAVVAGSWTSALAQAVRSADTGAARPVRVAIAAGADVNLEEVVVTARRREEKLIDVPVAASVVNAQVLAKYATTDLQRLSDQVPQLNLVKTGSGQGGAFFIRGIGSGIDAGIDQAVALNFDGVQISRARLVREAMFDLQDVQILEGPQALFFGKNSPAGVVSLTSASPGHVFEGYVRAGYEFATNQRYGEGAVSIPLTDTLAVRLAFRANASDGTVKNVAQPAPDPVDNPGYVLTGALNGNRTAIQEEMGRITIAWRPMATFDANLKVLIGHYHDNGDEGALETVCRGAHPVIGPFGSTDQFQDCRLNRVTSIGGLPTQIGAAYPESNRGVPFSDLDSIITSLTMNYRLPHLTITSVTGYYNYNAPNFDNFDASNLSISAGSNSEYTHTLTQEIRAVSSFDGPLNFTVGGFFEDVHRHFNNSGKVLPMALLNLLDGDPAAMGFDPTTGRSNDWTSNDFTNGTTYSAFGQLIWKLPYRVELAGGLRYTNETKFGSVENTYVNQLTTLNPALNIFLPEGDVISGTTSANNVSPEVTLSWHPADGVLVYGAYKTGFQSGGISNPGLPSAGMTIKSLLFNPETVRGGEVGLKISKSNVSADVTAYYYDFNNLQVQSFNAATLSYTITNAATAHDYGVEGNAQWQVSHRLAFSGNLSYNNASYGQYPIAPCFAGQTAAQGCVAGSLVSGQNLSGRQLPFAPRWAGRVGFTYDAPITESLKWGFTADLDYKSRTIISADFNQLAPDGGTQPAYVLLNASARLYTDRWELAVIAHNVTDKLYATAYGDLPQGAPGVESAAVGDPREVTLQLTYKF